MNVVCVRDTKFQDFTLEDNIAYSFSLLQEELYYQDPSGNVAGRHHDLELQTELIM